MKTWNEIRRAARAFAKKWRNAFDENSQKQSFLNDFFAVFDEGLLNQREFEYSVKRLDGSNGSIDCLLPGRLLVEMKSAGKNLDDAYEQACRYQEGLPVEYSAPLILICDFQRWRVYDRVNNRRYDFRLADLPRYVTLFGNLIGIEVPPPREEDPVNRAAAEKMAALYDSLKDYYPNPNELGLLLVRLLYCLFAEDTDIFNRNQFTDYIRHYTSPDGSDLAAKISELFEILNTPKNRRSPNTNEALLAFEYINGNLFSRLIPHASFSAEMRKALIACGELDWSKVSPVIFGAMFQGVMNEDERHDLGAHYTSEENILKVINPLFIDAFRAEFKAICSLGGPKREKKLKEFHQRLAAYKFLDPACGCGNFLLIAYRELRRLEMEILTELQGEGRFRELGGGAASCLISIEQFCGIELESFPCEIARTSLWLMQHLCNMEMEERFGTSPASVPLKEVPGITQANALTTPWPHADFIFGNPPFLGFTYTSAEQKADMRTIFPKDKMLDFVCCWYKKAADIARGTIIRCAFVSTNSITQGEQVPILWNNLPDMKIDFAHRTFKWHNEAKGVAAVHCVIIGFSDVNNTSLNKVIYDGEKETAATNINPYLVDAPDILVESRNKALCDVPKMVYGNKPTDGGNLLLSQEERDELLAKEPQIAPYVRKLFGSKEFLNNIPRYCLWLVDAPPSLIAKCPMVKARILKVKETRLASVDAGCRKLALRPSLFRDTNNPETAILVPSVSSERRQYVPMGFIGHEVIVNNLVLIIPNAGLYEFGVLESAVHMAWMRAVAGRLKSDYRYSKDVVYNNFVWPEVSEALKAKIERAAQKILDIRAKCFEQDATCTLAILYNPETMPPKLAAAHLHLDGLVDEAYGLENATETTRVAHLFRLYAKKVEN